MIKKHLTKLSIIITLLISTPVYADCFFNGNSYPEGTVINGKVCVNGEWR